MVLGTGKGICAGQCRCHGVSGPDGELRAARGNHICALMQCHKRAVDSAGVPRDAAAARYWLSRAADCGHPDALAHIGIASEKAAPGRHGARSRRVLRRGIGSCLAQPPVRDRRAGVCLVWHSRGGVTGQGPCLRAIRGPGSAAFFCARYPPRRGRYVGSMDLHCPQAPGPCSERVGPRPLSG